MPLVQTRGLSKRFPGIVALDDVDFEADAGEVRAVVGANGAGKSTFMNILAGVFPPSSGEIRLAGEPVAFDGTGTGYVKKVLAEIADATAPIVASD